MTQNDVLLSVRDLCVRFPMRRGPLGRITGYVRAVDGVSLDIPRGTTLGLVGESGCGKSTLSRAILRLIKADGGHVEFDGQDVLSLSRRQLVRLRRDAQIVFQDAVGSLNPRLSVGLSVAEPLVVHGACPRSEQDSAVGELLERVGLRASDAARFPHELSGGQRQRVGIARALALKPKLIICDEPVSALDVSIRLQILNLLRDVQAEFGLTYLFISHDLAVIRYVSDRVAVMYLGEIVETANTEEIFRRPAHPYTQALLAAVPVADPSQRARQAPLMGEMPSPLDPPSGCSFHPRCPIASNTCRSEAPKLSCHHQLDASHLVACHHVEEAATSMAT